MVAAPIDAKRGPRILIRGTDGVGKSALDASAQPLLFPAATRRLRPTASPLSANTEESR
jgi:hypothetical protein